MKKIILCLWGLWDWLYFHCNRMEYVSKGDNIFRVVRKTYKGPPLITNSGQWICPGDEIIKIHLYNYQLAKEILNFSSDVAYVLYLRKGIQRSMQGLSAYIIDLPDYERIKAIMGTSMLNRGAERFGFYKHGVEDTWYYRLKAYLYKFIYMLIHPQGLRYLKQHGSKLEIQHLVITVQELLQRYDHESGKPSS